MRWLAGIAALVVATLVLHVISATAPVEARATLGLGLLLLAAALGGALAARFGLPRVTGYIVAGLAMGPAWRGYVRADEVDALRIVLDAGFALIALALGMELKLDLLVRHARAIGRVVLGVIVVPLLAVALFVLLLGSWFPLTVRQPFGDRLTVALVLGALAAASSPLATKAVIDELRTRGLLTRLLQVVLAVKDAAIVLVVGLMLGVAALLGSKGTVEPSVLWRAPLVFIGSIGLGVAGGWVASLYLRATREHGPLIVVAWGFVAAYITLRLQLEVLVVGLSAGCFLINAARGEAERLLRVLGRGSVPLYAVTFVLFGAGLQLGALGDVWPWIVAIAVLRAFGLHYGLVWAGRDVGVSPTLVRHGWVGFVSQAGVTVGLATLVRRAFPEWGVSLEAFVLGMIGVHETIGPIMYRWALQRPGAGEARNAEVVQADSLAVVPGGRL